MKFALGLIEPRRQDLAQFPRRPGKAVQHFDEDRPRDAQHRRRLERGCRGRTLALGKQRHFSQQRAWSNRERAAVIGRREAESPLLDDKSAVRLIAGPEQHLAAVEVTGFRADVS